MRSQNLAKRGKRTSSRNSALTEKTFKSSKTVQLKKTKSILKHPAATDEAKSVSHLRKIANNPYRNIKRKPITITIEKRRLIETPIKPIIKTQRKEQEQIKRIEKVFWSRKHEAIVAKVFNG